MSDTACPSCNAPASPGASRCARCGYRFLEGGSRARPTVRRAPGVVIAVAAAVAAAALAAAAVVVLGDEGDDGAARSALAGALESSRHLEIISDHPLATPTAERRLEERFTALRDDDSAAVSCSEREPRPAHSIRRCRVRYPSGMERSIVLLTNANGSEVISER